MLVPIAVERDDVVLDVALAGLVVAVVAAAWLLLLVHDMLNMFVSMVMSDACSTHGDCCCCNRCLLCRRYDGHVSKAAYIVGKLCFTVVRLLLLLLFPIYSSPRTDSCKSSGAAKS